MVSGLSAGEQEFLEICLGATLIAANNRDTGLRRQRDERLAMLTLDAPVRVQGVLDHAFIIVRSVTIAQITSVTSR